jgi:hypothetical protein
MDRLGGNSPARPAYSRMRVIGACMSTRHAALALVVWYLMRPPLPHLNARAIDKDTAAPVSRWIVVRIFSTQKECEAHRSNPWAGASPAMTRASRKNSRRARHGNYLCGCRNEAGGQVEMM